MMSKTPTINPEKLGKPPKTTITLPLEKGAISGVAAVNPPPETPDGRPHPDWVRGRCPECGDDLISNMYFVYGRGYLLCWECWGSRGENAACSYRRVL